MASDDTHGELRMWLASPADIPYIEGLFYRSAVWLEGRGYGHPPVWPTPAFIAAAVAGRVARGEAWLASLGAAPPIATITVQPRDDLWPDDGLARYVHGLAVDRCAAGRGIGAYLLAWAAAQASTAGLDWLRLDCDASNSALRSYYRARGFIFCGERSAEHRTAALFERATRKDAT